MHYGEWPGTFLLLGFREKLNIVLSKTIRSCCTVLNVASAMQCTVCQAFKNAPWNEHIGRVEVYRLYAVFPPHFPATQPDSVFFAA